MIERISKKVRVLIIKTIKPQEDLPTLYFPSRINTANILR